MEEIRRERGEVGGWAGRWMGTREEGRGGTEKEREREREGGGTFFRGSSHYEFQPNN